MKSTVEKKIVAKHPEKVMMKLNSLIELIKVSKKSQQTISKILVGVDADILKEWLDKIHIKNGKFVGTFYQELAKRISFSDFVRLYKALGYDFKLLGHWMDMQCFGSQGCVSQKGFTCSPQTCIQT